MEPTGISDAQKRRHVSSIPSTRPGSIIRLQLNRPCGVSMSIVAPADACRTGLSAFTHRVSSATKSPLFVSRGIGWLIAPVLSAPSRDVSSGGASRSGLGAFIAISPFTRQPSESDGSHRWNITTGGEPEAGMSVQPFGCSTVAPVSSRGTRGACCASTPPEYAVSSKRKGRRISVHPLLGRHDFDIAVEGVQVHRAIVDAGLAAVAHPAQRMLHPLLVVALGEILAGVRAAGLGTVFG